MSNEHSHSLEVAELAVAIAARMSWPADMLALLRLAAMLHDVGKVAIPETILAKPGPLDEEEWDFVRQHAEIGQRIVSAAPSLVQAGMLIRSHHERYDGRGYPDRLAGDEIPYGAAIIAVCDAFCAMTKTRPYSDAISVADALAEIRRCSGSQFVPAVASTFCELIQEGPARQHSTEGAGPLQSL
jgi:putative nucleotidyltransferase with HDIG domain